MTNDQKRMVRIGKELVDSGYDLREIKADVFGDYEGESEAENPEVVAAIEKYLAKRDTK